MMKINYYITSHGFGHSTRAIEVINHLPEWLDVEIVTTAPRWLFDRSIHRRFTYRAFLHDAGIIQKNCLQNDVEETFRFWQNLLGEYPRLAREEGDRLRREKTALAVGDISPFAVAAAREAGIPSAIVANFSWDWIFADFLPTKPQFQDLIDRITGYYRETTLLIRTPLAGDLSVFPQVNDVPLIVRHARLNRQEARAELGLRPEDKVVVISFGGIGFDKIRTDYLESFEDITFLTFDERLKGLPNVRFLHPQTIYHPDIIQASDLAITKMGYGIVTECIAHRTPIAFPPRRDFREHGILVREAAQWIPIIPISEERFYSGDWEFLREFFKTDRWKRDEPDHRLTMDGGNKTAEILCQLIRNHLERD